jgi:multidrug efflux system outer membrane protein
MNTFESRARGLRVAGTFRLFFGAAGALAALTTGCAMGPAYERPKLVIPETFRDEAKPDDVPGLASLRWWEGFGEPALAALVSEALEANLDLGVAVQRVEQARQAARAAYWALYPTLGIGVGAGVAHGTSTTPTMVPGGTANGHFTGAASTSWEIDVWGRLRRAAEAAEHLAQATEDDRHALYLTVAAEVASAYFQLRILDLQIARGRAAIAIRQRTLELFDERAKGGVGNDLEQARAEANVREAEAIVVAFEQSATLTENALSLLLGRPSGTIARGAQLSALAVPPPVPAGLPSALLERRPDVRAAERRLMAANAQIGVAEASFFPRLDLTSFLGFASADLTRIAAAGASDALYGAAGTFGVAAPILGGERLRANLAAAKAEHRAASLLWKRASLNALKEVNDALVQVQRSREVHKARQAQADALTRATEKAEQRYRGGVSNYLELLTAQEQLLVAELAATQAKGQQFVALVTLYRSLGGGWAEPAKPPAATADREATAPAR